MAFQAKRQANWDRQFKFSAILSDFQDHLAWMENASQSVEDNFDLTRVHYGPHDRQWVEWAPTKYNGGPIVPTVIHGGYWRALRAEDHRFALNGLETFGGAVSNIEYRLLPEFRLDDLVFDIKTALLQLSEVLPKKSRLLLVGHSAGAHLAVSAACAPEVSPILAGVVAISGIYDLAPVSHSFLQAELKLTGAEITAHSLLGIHLDVPVMCIVGANETAEFQRNSDQMAEGAGAHLLKVTDCHHMSILKNLGNPDSPMIAAIKNWVDNKERVPGEVNSI